MNIKPIYCFLTFFFIFYFIGGCSSSVMGQISVIQTKIYNVGDTLNYDGLQKVWADDFNTGTMVDETNWTYEQGYVRNKENQYYTVARSENCKIENGMLVIEGHEEKPLYKNEIKYTSASITTANKLSWKYGRFEIRAKIPSGKGTWPAFWMKGDNQNQGIPWPDCGEIDIMEYAGKDSHIMIHNAIYANNGRKAVNMTLKHDYGRSLADDFHIYSLHWDEKQLVFAIDNTVTYSIDLSLLPDKNNPFHQEFFILLNLALGSDTANTLAGSLDAAILSIRYYVDYVHVYQEIK